MSEANFQKKIIKYLESIDAYVFKHNASAISKAGVPDIICCYRGLFMGIEVKKDNKSKPTELQKYNLNKINKCGGIGIVLRPDTFERFISLLDTLRRELQLQGCIDKRVILQIIREIGVE